MIPVRENSEVVIIYPDCCFNTKKKTNELDDLGYPLPFEDTSKWVEPTWVEPTKNGRIGKGCARKQWL